MTELSINKQIVNAFGLFIRWIFMGQPDISTEPIILMDLIDNTAYLHILTFFVYMTLHVFFSILWGIVNEIRAFKALPIDQVGLFTIQDAFLRIARTLFCLLAGCIVACIIYECVTNGINFTGTVGDTQYFPMGPVWMVHLIGMTLMVIYILYNGRYMYKEIALRTSILYTIQRHPYITFHNARHFCEQFSLGVFPVKIFERLHYEKPDTTLFDLEKVVRKAQRHVTFMKELGDTNSHLCYIQPVVLSSQ